VLQFVAHFSLQSGNRGRKIVESPDEEKAMKRIIGTILISAALAASVASATAQGHDEHQRRPFSRPTEQVDARLAYIHAALKITDAQQTQWNVFAEKMRQLAAAHEKTMQQRREKTSQTGGKHEHRRLSIIERMEQAQRMHADAVARINEVLSVEKPLYEALSPEQRQVADVVLAPHGHRGGFDRGHGMGRGKPRGQA
jgi:periplasmic protein CpxP/Spy